jgi:uncharacterized membrane protein YccC
MHYTLNIRTFLSSHYFYSGMRTCAGVAIIAACAYMMSEATSAITISIGALCTSLLDLASPLKQKFKEMSASAVLSASVALVVSVSAPLPWISEGTILVISFIASMLVAYGKKAMSLQFAMMFIMILSVGNEVTASESALRAGLVLLGGAIYIGYAIVVGWLMHGRFKQQILAEALFEMASCISIKAGFYGSDVNLQKQSNRLVTQLCILAERQQAVRDILLRKNPSKADIILLQVHFVMIDMFEALLSTHDDYALLHTYFGYGDILTSLHELMGKARRNVESIAYNATKNRCYSENMSYTKDLDAIESQLNKIRIEAANGVVPEAAFSALSASCKKTTELIELLSKLRSATQVSLEPLPIDMNADMTPFLTAQKYEIRLLLSNIAWRSPIFRFAARMTMAIATCLIVAKHLQYADHAYWLMLTVAIILKPSFSLTKTLRTQQVTGNLIGCVLAAFILMYVHNSLALVSIILVLTVIATTFLQVKFGVTTVATSLRTLILISLLSASTDPVIWERLSDTLIGALIATAFNFVLPSWEYHRLPTLASNLLIDVKKYIESSCDLLQGKVDNEFHYRLSRRKLSNSLVSLNTALLRTIDEPRNDTLAIEGMRELIVHSYLLIAHVAQLNIVLGESRTLLSKDLLEKMIDATRTATNLVLTDAKDCIEGKKIKPNELLKTIYLSEVLDYQIKINTRTAHVANGFWLLNKDVRLIAQCSQVMATA